MSFNSYITYNEYIALGGTIPETEFSVLERKAQRLLDYITFDRIKSLTTIPYEVKEVLTEFINKSYVFNSQTEQNDTISEYSNGVETITYRLKTEEEQDAEFRKLAYKYLPDYLVARSVNFDVKKYLQSESNNT